MDTPLTRTNLFGLDRQALREWFAQAGEKPYRADQVMKWMYHRHVTEFTQMTDIGKTLCAKLQGIAEVVPPNVLFEKQSTDGTHKWLLGMDAGSNLYLLDGYRHKMGLRERWLKMRDLRTRWMREPGVQSVRVGYERFGLNDALEYFEEQMRLEAAAFEVVELAWPNEGPGSKSDRVQRLEPAFRMGKIFLAAAITREENGKQVPAETKAQEHMRSIGQEHRIFKPVKKIDPNTGGTYSLNKVLLDEYLLFPFSQTKDFIDAMSRIYDMEPRPPVIVDESALEPEVFADGA